VGEAYARARELAVALNRPRVLLIALFGQWVSHATQADLGRAGQLAAELRELGETGGDVHTQVMGCAASGFTYLLVGEFAAGRAYMEKGLALYDPADRLFYAELLPNHMLAQLHAHSS
jgi:hypothetical protein